MYNGDRITNDFGMCPFDHRCGPECQLFDPTAEEDMKCRISQALDAITTFYSNALGTGKDGSLFPSFFVTAKTYTKGDK